MKTKKEDITKKLAFLLSILFFVSNVSFANSDLNSNYNTSASSVVSKKSVVGKNKYKASKKKIGDLYKHTKKKALENPGKKKYKAYKKKTGKLYKYHIEKKVLKVIPKPTATAKAITIKANVNGYQPYIPAAAVKPITIEASENSYQPYVQVGGTRFFNVHESKAAATADLFVPLWQEGLADLIFTDLRINDRSGTPFEGNIHLGYRHLFLESQESLGFYGAFDRKRTQFSNYFNQLTIGGEYWIKDWFIGANYYQPIGNTEKPLNRIVTSITPFVADQAIMGVNLTSEKAMPGADTEVGYEFVEGLVGYVGGYYFGANNAATVYGPRARLSYDWSLSNGRRILGIFDKVGLEAGIQRDKPRGVTGYLSANVRIGWLLNKKSALRGVSRHMIDPIRRDIDVVSGGVTKQESKALSSEDLLNREFEKDSGYVAADPAVKAQLDERVENAKAYKVDELSKKLDNDPKFEEKEDFIHAHPTVQKGYRAHHRKAAADKAEKVEQERKANATPSPGAGGTTPPNNDADKAAKAEQERKAKEEKAKEGQERNATPPGGEGSATPPNNDADKAAKDAADKVAARKAKLDKMSFEEKLAEKNTKCENEANTDVMICTQTLKDGSTKKVKPVVNKFTGEIDFYL